MSNVLAVTTASATSMSNRFCRLLGMCWFWVVHLKLLPVLGISSAHKFKVPLLYGTNDRRKRLQEEPPLCEQSSWTNLGWLSLGCETKLKQGDRKRTHPPVLPSKTLLKIYLESIPK